MKVAFQIQDIPKNISLPCALTLGTFDGLHLGHQQILKKLKKFKTKVVITFAYPPFYTFHPQEKKNSLPL